MKLKIFLFTLAAIMVFANAEAQITKAEIVATGLTCSMCSNAINKQLKSLSEVDSVVIDLNSNTFVVHVKKETIITPRILKEKVEKAGFFVGSMIVTMSFENVEVSDNYTIEKDGFSMVFVETKTKVLHGETKAKIMDKGFVTQKEFKKLSKSLSKYQTYIAGNEDDYHVKVMEP
jgi:copper chaperone CopZ